jgi:Zn ribbon nucleic-acid-binding protein
MSLAHDDRDRFPAREEIEACSDAATLALWYRDMVETIESIKAQVYGFRLAGVTQDDWLQRAGKKAGFLRMASGWVERRMLTLDLPVPYLPSDPRQEELRRQRVRIEQLLKALTEAGVDVPAANARGRTDG